MSKIHPISPSSHSSLERETFTIWMKSLVFHGNGCTVYNSRGEVAFRVDNYQKKCSRKVLLMDSSGQVLFSLHTKKLGIFRCWEGFKWTDSERRNARPLFRVRKNIKFLSKDISCQVINLGFDKNSGNNYYSITGLEGKSALKIVDFSGQLLAEAVQKQSSEGICLGDDVLRLMVEPHADQSLVMALVIVFGLINNKL